MSKVLIWVLSFSVIVSSSRQPQLGEYMFSVKGRVLDASGQPVKDASIVVSALPEPVMGDIGFVVKADREGRFHYSETTRDSRLERLLYVVGPLNEDAVSLIRPPFYWLPNLPSEQYAGRRIRIKPNGVLDLGDVPIQIRYETVNVQIQDQSGTPILRSVVRWQYVWLRIRDLRRLIIYEGGLSKDTIQTKVRLSESIIPIDLPEGTWWLEISPDGYYGTWYSSPTPINITSKGSPINLTLRIPVETKRQSK